MKPGPSLEQELKREMHMTAVRRAVLGAVAAAGVLSVAVVAPNALGVLRPFLAKYKRQRQYQAKKAFARLIENGFLTIQKTDRGSFAILTEKGRDYMNRLELRNYKIQKPKRWDKKWRLVIFDISEKRKKLRNQARATLRQLGFLRLQDSVWVYPYDCEEVIVLLKTQLRIGKEILYIIADKIENDKTLRVFFNLNK